MYLKIFIIGYLICANVIVVHAYVPNLIEQTSLRDIVTIDDPELSQAFYGSMTGFPHTYEITVTKPLHLYTHIRVPDIETSINNVSGIIIKEQGRGKRVLEISRLSAKDAEWKSNFDISGGDSYREGSTFEGELEAGTYRIEVSTPDNLSKYVLMIGTREEMSIGYFERIGRLMDVKLFFEKSRFRIIESPYVYVPLLVVLMSCISIFWYRRHRHGNVV